MRYLAQDCNGQMLWPVVPKYHKLWHLGFEAQFENPRHAMCFGGEDFIRIVKIIAESCRHGTKLPLRSKKVMENYILGMALKLARGNE